MLLALNKIDLNETVMNVHISKHDDHFHAKLIRRIPIYDVYTPFLNKTAHVPLEKKMICAYTDVYSISIYNVCPR